MEFKFNIRLLVKALKFVQIMISQLHNYEINDKYFRIF
jgi:hypothetical protein